MGQSAPLYVRVMGDSSWKDVAEPIRAMHATHGVTRACGHLRVEHGRHSLARVLARMLRLPNPSAAAETRLTITALAGREQWERIFDGRRVRTLQYQSDARELAERFGVLELRFRLHASGGSLLYVQRAAAFLWWVVRLRIPAPIAPRVEAREDPLDPTRVQVDVRVTLPGIGPLIAYAGIIEVEATHA